MFTGIIEEVGSIRSVVSDDTDARDLVVAASARLLEDLDPGDSISIDGVCQTVVRVGEDEFEVHAVATTLSRTTLGSFEAGRRVNLERPVAVGARFGGHFVQGHVDGVGTVAAIDREGEMVRLRVRLPEEARRYTVLHGSVALDGVSLTVNELSEDGTAEVALIPYTYAHTNLSRLTVDDRVNVEADLIGKHVARLLRGPAASR